LGDHRRTPALGRTLLNELARSNADVERAGRAARERLRVAST
jgi:hypothetical protein